MIVTFEPDLAQLERLVGVLAAGGVRTTVADNGSSEFDSIEAIGRRHGCIVTGGGANRGIPAHLNEMLESTSAEWILYLDQDSGLTSESLAQLLARAARTASPACGATKVGLISPTYRQASTGQPGYSERHLRRSTRTPIGSGSLYRCAACRSIGGFSELFPLDLSDFDTALRLQDHGYSVCIETDIEISHQVGNRPTARGIGQPELHTAWRYFLKADATRRMTRRHWFRHPLWMTRLIVARVVEAVRSSKVQRDLAVIEEFVRGLIGLRSRRVPSGLLTMVRPDR